LTKQPQKVVKARQADAGLLNQSELSALCLGGGQHALDFERDGPEHYNRVAAFDSIELVKSYEEGKLHIVLKVSAGFEPSDYEFFSLSKVGTGTVTLPVLGTLIVSRLMPAAPAVRATGIRSRCLLALHSLLRAQRA